MARIVSYIGEMPDLAHMALGLWRLGAREIRDADPIGFCRVFLATLLNPKNLIFAFAIFSHRLCGIASNVPLFHELFSNLRGSRLLLIVGGVCCIQRERIRGIWIIFIAGKHACWPDSRSSS